MRKDDSNKELNRRLSRVEAFAYALPVLALLIPLLLVILIPKTDFTRAILGGWNAVLVVTAILGGALWWSNRLLKTHTDRAQAPERGEGP